jgi:hypothetical protein
MLPVLATQPHIYRVDMHFEMCSRSELHEIAQAEGFVHQYARTMDSELFPDKEHQQRVIVSM